MLLALLTTFAASRKEPLAAVLERIHAAIIAADFGEPDIQFALADSSVAGGVSSVDRVRKRFPQLERFVQSLAPYPGGPETRVISNRTSSDRAAATVDFATLVEIARGVPRSFPFHSMSMHFSVPAFSGGAPLPSIRSAQLPGITVGDSWWVNGRLRSVAALTMVEADPAAKKLPKLPDAVAAVLAASGKVKKTIQAPLVAGAPPKPQTLETAAPEIAQALRAVVHDYRTRISEVVERARLPHDLPPNQEAAAPLGMTVGPKKPELVRAFTAMGYDCRVSREPSRCAGARREISPRSCCWTSARGATG